MKSFTIDNETNNIAVHSSVKEAEAVSNSERFATEAALAKLEANWPASRLVEIFNRLPGETPVKKFKDRATAVSRIWKAIQTLAQDKDTHGNRDGSRRMSCPRPARRSGCGARRAAPEEPEQPATTEATTTETAASTDVLPQGADVAPAEPAPTKKATGAKKADTAQMGAPRDGSKTSQVIAMLKREGGTTLEEIMREMGWLKRTTRAMLSAGGSPRQETRAGRHQREGRR